MTGVCCGVIIHIEENRLALDIGKQLKPEQECNIHISIDRNVQEKNCLLWYCYFFFITFSEEE